MIISKTSFYIHDLLTGPFDLGFMQNSPFWSKGLSTKVQHFCLSIFLSNICNQQPPLAKKYFFEKSRRWKLDRNNKAVLHGKREYFFSFTFSFPTLILFQCNFIAFDRTHTTHVGFYDVPWVMIADARSFQAFAAIFDWLTHLASISC